MLNRERVFVIVPFRYHIKTFNKKLQNLFMKFIKYSQVNNPNKIYLMIDTQLHNNEGTYKESYDKYFEYCKKMIQNTDVLLLGNHYGEDEICNWCKEYVQRNNIQIVYEYEI